MVASTSCDTLLPLNMLKAGETASIVDLVGESSQVHRLQEMGLRTGATIRMLKPGAPCVVALDGKRLSLRLSGLLDIYVALSAA